MYRVEDAGRYYCLVNNKEASQDILMLKVLGRTTLSFMCLCTSTPCSCVRNLFKNFSGISKIYFLQPFLAWNFLKSYTASSRLLDSTVSKDAGIEPRADAVLAMAVRGSSTRLNHIYKTGLDLIQIGYRSSPCPFQKSLFTFFSFCQIYCIIIFLGSYKQSPFPPCTPMLRWTVHQLITKWSPNSTPVHSFLSNCDENLKETVLKAHTSRRFLIKLICTVNQANKNYNSLLSMNSCFALLQSFQIYDIFLDNLFFISVYIYIYIELSYLVGPHFVFKLTFPSIYHFFYRGIN